MKKSKGDDKISDVKHNDDERIFAQKYKNDDKICPNYAPISSFYDDDDDDGTSREPGSKPAKENIIELADHNVTSIPTNTYTVCASPLEARDVMPMEARDTTLNKEISEDLDARKKIEGRKKPSK